METELIPLLLDAALGRRPHTRARIRVIHARDEILCLQPRYSTYEVMDHPSHTAFFLRGLPIDENPHCKFQKYRGRHFSPEEISEFLSLEYLKLVLVSFV